MLMGIVDFQYLKPVQKIPIQSRIIALHISLSYSLTIKLYDPQDTYVCMNGVAGSTTMILSLAGFEYYIVR